jgi:hypothetical protein
MCSIWDFKICGSEALSRYPEVQSEVLGQQTTQPKDKQENYEHATLSQQLAQKLPFYSEGISLCLALQNGVLFSGQHGFWRRSL